MSCNWFCCGSKARSKIRWVEIISSSWSWLLRYRDGWDAQLASFCSLESQSQPGRVYRDRSAPSLQLWAALVESNPQLEPALKNRLNQFYSTLPNQHKAWSSNNSCNGVMLQVRVAVERLPPPGAGKRPSCRLQSHSVHSVHCGSIAIRPAEALTNGFGKASQRFQLKSGQASRRFSRVSIVGKILLGLCSTGQPFAQQYLLRYLNRLGKFDKSGRFTINAQFKLMTRTAMRRPWLCCSKWRIKSSAT